MLEEMERKMGDGGRAVTANNVCPLSRCESDPLILIYAWMYAVLW